MEHLTEFEAAESHFKYKRSESHKERGARYVPSSESSKSVKTGENKSAAEKKEDIDG